MAEITPELLLRAYADGYFPMAEHRDAGQLYWFSPDKRGILPLEAFHIPASLNKLLKKHPFTVTLNTCFPDIVHACADRNETWINDHIINLYITLWEQGFAHSVECWNGDALAGGLYGVALGGAFFGESMFSRMPNASKVALCELVRLLKQGGYTLLDTQYVNNHLLQFGAVEISKKDYLERLKHALGVVPQPVFPPPAQI